MIDKCAIKGSINLKQYKKDILVAEYDFNNIITEDGINYFRRYFGGQYGPINRIGLGNSDEPVDDEDTELGNKLILLDINGKDYNSTNDSVSFLASVPEGFFTETVSFREGGLIYKSTTQEILITRVVFPQIVYQTTDLSLSLSYTLKLKGGFNE